MIPDTDKAYIAGLFDGEGSIHMRRGIEKKKKRLGEPGGPREKKTFIFKADDENVEKPQECPTFRHHNLMPYVRSDNENVEKPLSLLF